MPFQRVPAGKLATVRVAAEVLGTRRKLNRSVSSMVQQLTHHWCRTGEAERAMIALGLQINDTS